MTYVSAPTTTSIRDVQEDNYSKGKGSTIFYNTYSRKKKMLFQHWEQFQSRLSSKKDPIFLSNILSYFNSETGPIPMPTSAPTTTESNNIITQLSAVNYFPYTGKITSVLVPQDVKSINVYMW